MVGANPFTVNNRQLHRKSDEPVAFDRCLPGNGALGLRDLLIDPTQGHNASHKCPIREATIFSGAPAAATSSPRSSSACPAANRCQAAAFNACTPASSCAEPKCSMLRDPRREECTICTARAPELVRTVRT